MKKLIIMLLCLSLISSDELRAQGSHTHIEDQQDHLEFVNGFSKVYKDASYSFVSQKGVLLLPYSFSDVRNFSNGLAAVEQNGKWGFIDAKGNWVFKPAYDIVFDFEKKQTVAVKNNHWFVLDLTGKVVSNFGNATCMGIQKEGIWLETSNQQILIDKTGKIINDRANTTNVQTQRELTTGINNGASCPNNIDFENGSFDGWTCFKGRVDTIGASNVVTVSTTTPVDNRHKIIQKNYPAEVDPYGLFSLNPTDGSNYAVKLGNKLSGGEAERISYKIHVPENATDFSIKYDYAVVFQDPGHTTVSQPRFLARLFDSTTNMYVDCASYQFISTSNIPGFATSLVDPNVKYKPWSSVYINMKAYAGRTMYLEFTTTDCARRSHWGYAYLDVESVCQQNIGVQYSCSYPNLTELDAPDGFNQYKWWNEDFSVLFATGQHATLNPGPTAGSRIQLELVPYIGFGCTDTLEISLNASNFSPTFSIQQLSDACHPYTILCKSNDASSSQVTWNFSDGTYATGDSVLHTFNQAGSVTVTNTTMLTGGCSGSSTDTIELVNTVATPTLLYEAGNFCKTARSFFQINTAQVDSIRWDFGDGTILTSQQNTLEHLYSQQGHFLPRATVYLNTGCMQEIAGLDTIYVEQLAPSFTYTTQKACQATSLTFYPQTNVGLGALNYVWNLGGDYMSSEINPEFTFSANTTQAVSLIVMNNWGCSDTIQQIIPVSVITLPEITISAPAEACVHTPVSLITTIQTTDSVLSMVWTPANGLRIFGDTTTFVFQEAGLHTMMATIHTAHGCMVQQAKTINILAAPVLTGLTNMGVCDGANVQMLILDTISNIASLHWVNDNPQIGLSASGNGNIPAFSAINTDSIAHVAQIHLAASSALGCLSDTILYQITVHPKPRVLLPTEIRKCENSLALVTVQGNAQNYQWSPADGINCQSCGQIQISGNSIRQYTVTGTDLHGCSSTATLAVDVVRPFKLDARIADTICSGQAYQLQASNASNYQWYPALGLSDATDANPIAKPSVTTHYKVIASDEFGCFTDSTFLTVFIAPLNRIDVSNEYSVINGSTLNLTPNVSQNSTNPIVSYEWTPATYLSCTTCPDPKVNVTEDITYTLQTTDSKGCVTQQSFTIKVLAKNAKIYIPNTFSPDGNGMNDVFMIRGSGFAIKSLRIFNRYNKQVFSVLNAVPNNERLGWDGKINGVNAPADAYTFVAELLTDEGETVTQKGSVTLLR